MKANRLFPIALLLGLVIIRWATGNVVAMNLRPGITDEDKAEIISQMLRRELVGKEVNEKDELVSDFELLVKAKGGIVLSNKHLESLVPEILEIRVMTLSPREIQRKADREGDFMYLVFTQFDVKGVKVLVTLTKTWAKGRSSTMIYLSGGAETYEYQRKNGKWVGKFLQGYVV